MRPTSFYNVNSYTVKACYFCSQLSQIVTFQKSSSRSPILITTQAVISMPFGSLGWHRAQRPVPEIAGVELNGRHDTKEITY